ncbi:MAG: hypothetical protein RIS76_2672 [Verrucomicrobiota bacterium]|jgi:hypothetical protein
MAEISKPDFTRDIQPLLTQYCSDCHADGANKGGVAFDQLKGEAGLPGTPELWLAVLKNVRAGLMPPAKKARPTDEEQRRLETWIKYGALGLDPSNPDPGRVTVRRLNRVEYRNTVRDLLGAEFKAEEEFPPDDTGHGFDNIGDVLTVSPMLLEKYLKAARTLVEQSVPMVSGVPAEQSIAGRRFQIAGESSAPGDGPLSLPYPQAAVVTNRYPVAFSGRYQLVLNLTATEKFVDDVFDYSRCRLVFRVDGEEVLRREFARESDRTFRLEAERDWTAGDHELRLELEPLTPEAKPVRSLALRINQVIVRGPMAPEHWVKPGNYTRIFPRDPPPDAVGRRAYAAELLEDFATRAFRRPVDAATRERLAALAETVYSEPGKTFEAGVAQGMVAVLASPRFLFREEEVEAPARGQKHPFVDPYSLASRLSYFLWSSMPDAELLRLAANGTLRTNLPAQVKRMMADGRSAAFMQNFTGQWLQSRDIETVVIDSRAVLGREDPPDPDRDRRMARFRELRGREESTLMPEEKEELSKLRTTLFRSGRQRPELTGDLRRAMRRETEMVFEHILREDRSVLEFIDSDYTFLNERLAKHYGLTNLTVAGDDMRRVTLPAGSARGGVLTQGTVLAVTSNPTRTSPVKRGVFLLENVLGTPPPPPPPDIPPLEEAAKAAKERTLSLRETLEMHRSQPICSSCHNRMDPLGLALENFNAMGMWREQELGQPVDPTGRLSTGEAFQDVRELKRILATDRRVDFYRCLTEKLMIYALGRGLEYTDVATVDRIVQRLEASGGRPSELILGVVESAPFQQRRSGKSDRQRTESTPPIQRADLKKSP